MLFEIRKEFESILEDKDLDNLLLENKDVGETILLKMITSGIIELEPRITMLKKLFESKVDVNSKDSGGRTPLHLIIFKGCYDIAELLIENKAQLNIKDDYGNTPLHYSRNLSTTKLLIENKADINIRNNEGNTPLHFKFRKDYFDIAKLIIENKAQLNVKNNFGDTVLNCSKDLCMVKLFIENKADVNIKNSMGHSPLHRCKNIEIAKVFIEHKADVNALTNKGSTPLHFCEDEDMAKVLIEHKANINALTNRGSTPLHFCSNKYFEIIKVLVKAKADTNIKNKFGLTFLEIHENYKNAEILQVLFEEEILFKITDKMKITPELFKEHTKFIMRCILNYDNEVQNVINLMV